MSPHRDSDALRRELIKNDVSHIRERAVSVERIDRMVGNTPMVRLRKTGDPHGAPIYLKMEDLNPSGSIRDRYITEILHRGVEAGQIMAGDAIALAGLDDSTLSAALLGAVLDLEVHAFIPEGAIPRLLPLVQEMGVSLHWTPAPSGLDGAIDAAVKWTHERPERTYIDGFRREAVRDAYHGIADEILLAMRGMTLGSFITSVSTGGTFREVAPHLRASHPALTMAGAVVLDVDLDELRQEPSDILRHVPMKRVWQMRDLVARHEGILIGPKGAACVALALELQPTLPADHAIVALNPDAGQRYLGWEPQIQFLARPPLPSPR